MDKTGLAQSPSVHGEIEEIFRLVGRSGLQQRLRTVKGVCRFDITGAGTWDVAVKDGEISVAEGKADGSHANCVVTVAPNDFVRIVRHVDNMNFMTAVLQEIVTIKGDLVFAYTVLGSFVFPTSGAPTH